MHRKCRNKTLRRSRVEVDIQHQTGAHAHSPSFSLLCFEAAHALPPTRQLRVDGSMRRHPESDASSPPLWIFPYIAPIGNSKVLRAQANRIHPSNSVAVECL
jgi:hypothetical protein